MKPTMEKGTPSEWASRRSAAGFAGLAAFTGVAYVLIVMFYVFHRYDSSELGREFAFALSLWVDAVLAFVIGLGSLLALHLLPPVVKAHARKLNTTAAATGLTAMGLFVVLDWIAGHFDSLDAAPAIGLCLGLPFLISAIISFAAVKVLVSRRFLRIYTTECCSHCGYPIGSSDVCTECGAPVAIRTMSSK